jgi:hypothetical protein
MLGTSTVEPSKKILAEICLHLSVIDGHLSFLRAFARIAVHHLFNKNIALGNFHEHIDSPNIRQ